MSQHVDMDKRAFMGKFGKSVLAEAGMAILMTSGASLVNYYGFVKKVR